MRQVTGRSSNNSNSKASIRLASGGRFFSASSLNDLADSGDIEVVVDTAKATLVPIEVASSCDASQLLSLAQLSYSQDEIAIFTEPVDGCVAAVAISSTAHKAITDRLGLRMRVTTPLLDFRHSEQNCISIICGESCYYIHLYNNGLKVAETLCISEPEDLLYYIHKIATIEQLHQNTPIYIIKADKEVVKTIKKYYKVICE